MVFKQLPVMKFQETEIQSIDDIFSGVDEILTPINEINSRLLKEHFKQEKLFELIRLTFAGIKTSIDNKAMQPSIDLAGLMTGSVNVEMPDPEWIFDSGLEASPAVALAKKLLLALTELVMKVKATVEEKLPAIPDKVSKLVEKCSGVDPTSLVAEAQEAFSSNVSRIPAAVKNAKNNLAHGLKLKRLLDDVIHNVKRFFEELLNSMNNVTKVLTEQSLQHTSLQNRVIEGFA